MTRYYCDKCGNECNPNELVKLILYERPFDDENWRNRETIYADICNKCKIEILNRFNDQFNYFRPEE